MPRLLRYSRIGWTAGCGVVCVVFVMLWVRSYSYSEVAKLRNANAALNSPWWAIELKNQPGGFLSNFYYGPSKSHKSRRYFSYERYADYAQNPIRFDYMASDFGGWGRIITLQVPHWFAALAVGLVGAVVWLPWRFSLLTMLVVITAVSLLLGMLAYAM